MNNFQLGNVWWVRSTDFIIFHITGPRFGSALTTSLDHYLPLTFGKLFFESVSISVDLLFQFVSLTPILSYQVKTGPYSDTIAVCCISASPHFSTTTFWFTTCSHSDKDLAVVPEYRLPGPKRAGAKDAGPMGAGAGAGTLSFDWPSPLKLLVFVDWEPKLPRRC